jgi:hypothetical protein
MRFLRTSMTTFAVFSLSLCLEAQSTPTAGPVSQASKSKSRRPDFGIADDTVVNVPSYAFQPGSSSDQVTENGAFFRYFTATSSDHFLAPVFGIPSGVLIDGLALNNCSVADGDLVYQLYIGDWDGNQGGGVQLIATGSSTAGCGADSATTSSIYDVNLGKPLFAVVAWENTHFDGSVRFNDMAISFHRMVSPAPGSATFNDVPTSHPFFQYIEALSASGITGGCQASPPLYCPDDLLTRGQMAVFLAKALGLHWPN